MSHRSDAGMTLLEILVVLALLALISTAIAAMVIPKYQEAKVQTAKMEVKKLSQEVQQFMISRDRCPTIEDLVEARFIPEPPRDPWGSLIAMRCPGEQDISGVDVFSAGPDRAEGTEDDVRSWKR